MEFADASPVMIYTICGNSSLETPTTPYSIHRAEEVNCEEMKGGELARTTHAALCPTHDWAQVR